MIYLYIWTAAVVLTYMAVWFDYIYYKYNLPKHCRKIIDSLTEEE